MRWTSSSARRCAIASISPESLATDIDTPVEARDVLQLITLRAAGQFNTTIYNYDDRFRGIHGGRMVVLMHRNDIDRLGLHEGDFVKLVCAVDDGVTREVDGLRVTPYDIPGRLLRRLLPGMQSAHSAVAPRGKGQGSRRQSDPGANYRHTC